MREEGGREEGRGVLEATAPVATSLVASVAAHQKAPVGGSHSKTVGVCEGNFGQQRTLSPQYSRSLSLRWTHKYHQALVETWRENLRIFL